MYRKNTSGQFLCFQMLLTATGAIATGLSPAVRRCIDGTFAAGGGTVTEDTGTGSYKYAMAQADTNGNDISFIFSATGAIPVCINFITTVADPTDGVRLGLTSLPNAAAAGVAGLPVLDANSLVDVDVKRWLANAVAAAANGIPKVDVDTIKTNPVVNGGTLTFPSGATLASTTNITAGTMATVTNLTNLPAIPSNWLTAAGIDGAALNGKGDWNIGKTGYSLTQAFPANFSALGIGATGHIVDVDTVGALTGYATAPTADENADALLDRTAGVETNRTLRQALRLMLAALAGKLDGAATAQVRIRDTNDSKDRIVAAVDADGNRSSVTLDAS